MKKFISTAFAAMSFCAFAIQDICMSFTENGVRDTVHWYVGVGGTDTLTFAPKTTGTANSYRIFHCDKKSDILGITFRLLVSGGSEYVRYGYDMCVARVNNGVEVISSGVSWSFSPKFIAVDMGGSHNYGDLSPVAVDVTLSVNTYDVFRLTNLTGETLNLNALTIEDNKAKYTLQNHFFPHREDVEYRDDSNNLLTVNQFEGMDCITESRNVCVIKSKSFYDHETSGLLVYANLKSGSTAGKILFGSSGLPLYSKFKKLIDSVVLNTEWVFDQDYYGSPSACVNGENVCLSHATTHIVTYDVGKITSISDPIDFTMSISINDPEKIGGSCVFRCWDKDYGSYDECPQERRASVSGDQSTTARFRATFNIVQTCFNLQALN